MALDITALRGKLNELTRKSNRSEILWKPTEGENVVRIVPLADRPSNPFVEMKFHYLGGKTNLSPLTFDEPDPIMEFCQSLRAGARLSREEWLETRKFEAKPRTFVPIIVRGEEGKGVRFWGFGKTIFTELLSIIDDEDYGDITHPKTGRDLKLTFTPKEKSPTRFPQTTIRVSPKVTPLSEDTDQIKEWLSEQPDIYEAYPRKSYEELETFLKAYLEPAQAQSSVSDDWGEDTSPIDEDESPSASSSKKNNVSAEDAFAEIFEGDD